MRKWNKLKNSQKLIYNIIIYLSIIYGFRIYRMCLCWTSCSECYLSKYCPNYNSCSCNYCVWSFIGEFMACMACICCCYDPFTELYESESDDNLLRFGCIQFVEPYRYCACFPVTLAEYKQFKKSKYTCSGLCYYIYCCGNKTLRTKKPHFSDRLQSEKYDSAQCNQMCLFYLYGPFSIAGCFIEHFCVATSMMCSCSTNICNNLCSLYKDSCVGCLNDLSSFFQKAPQPDQAEPSSEQAASSSEQAASSSVQESQPPSYAIIIGDLSPIIIA